MDEWAVREILLQRFDDSRERGTVRTFRNYHEKPFVANAKKTRITKVWMHVVQHGRERLFLLHLDDEKAVTCAESINDL